MAEDKNPTEAYQKASFMMHLMMKHGVNNHLYVHEDVHKDETAILFGTGPTLNDYEPIKEKAILVGVNHIGKRKLFDQSLKNFTTLDYYFFGDRDRHDVSKGLPNTSIAWKREFKVKIEKFCACVVDKKEHPVHYSMTECVWLGASPIEITHGEDGYFPKDIAKEPLYGHTIAMAAMQFLLYAGVKKIYLVGCDCGGGKFIDNIVWNWKELKEFRDKEYPEVKIISINPVALKGVFENAYQ